MKNVRLFAGLLLIVQVLIISYSVWIIMNDTPTFLTYFNLVLNSVFGVVNIRTLMM